MNIKYKGSFVALLTPFANGQLDEVAFQKFVEWQIIQGTSGLVPCGTTGESPTLSHNEHERLIDLTVEVSNGRVPVMAGTGSNSTEEAINLTEYAKKAGADSALIVMPYYNKPTQEGMYAHFKAINDESDLSFPPIIIETFFGNFSLISFFLLTTIIIFLKSFDFKALSRECLNKGLPL